ncbi:MAG: hypothetical protein PVG54_10245 [Anaerolineae bacterium]
MVESSAVFVEAFIERRAGVSDHSRPILVLQPLACAVAGRRVRHRAIVCYDV